MNESPRPETPMPPASPKNIPSLVGIVVLIVAVVVAILLITAFSKPTAQAPTITSPSGAGATLEPPLSSSDDLDAIDQDLQNSSVENLDAELPLIEGEL